MSMRVSSAIGGYAGHDYSPSPAATFPSTLSDPSAALRDVRKSEVRAVLTRYNRVLDTNPMRHLRVSIVTFRNRLWKESPSDHHFGHL